MPAKIKDLTKDHTGKWFEVGYFCTEDTNESLTIVAKMLDREGALFYAEWYNKTHAGFNEIVVR